MAFDIQPPKNKRSAPVQPQPKPVSVKPVKKEKVEKIKPIKVKKSKPTKTKSPKTKRQGSGLVVKSFIILIGIAILVGGVIFIRQIGMDNSSDDIKQSGIVDKFTQPNDTENTTVPVTEPATEPSGPATEVVGLHNIFVDKLDALEVASQEDSAVVDNDAEILNTFSDYLNEF